jgi:hypothetical protein
MRFKELIVLLIILGLFNTSCKVQRSIQKENATKKEDTTQMSSSLMNAKMLSDVIGSVPEIKMIAPAVFKEPKGSGTSQGITGEGRHWYVNMQRNSRQSSAITGDKIKIKNSTENDHYMYCGKIMTNGLSLVVSDNSGYFIVYENGTKSAFQMAHSAMTIIESGKEAFGVNALRSLGWVPLDEKNKWYEAFAGHASFYQYPWMLSFGNKLFCCGPAAKMDIHDPTPPGDNACLFAATFDLPSDAKASPLGLQALVSSNACYITDSRRVSAASDGKTVMVAIPGNLLEMDWNGAFKKRITGSFLPLEISLDEANRSYLLSTNSKNNFELFVITSDGELVYNTDLQVEESVYQDIVFPPAIGYDHTAYCTVGKDIIAVGSDGKIKYRQRPMPPLGGMVVMSDNRLLVAEGTVLSIWDGEGERKVVWSFGDEEVMSSPYISENSDVYALTNKNLYRLTSEK